MGPKQNVGCVIVKSPVSGSLSAVVIFMTGHSIVEIPAVGMQLPESVAGGTVRRDRLHRCVEKAAHATLALNCLFIYTAAVLVLGFGTENDHK